MGLYWKLHSEKSPLFLLFLILQPFTRRELPPFWLVGFFPRLWKGGVSTFLEIGVLCVVLITLIYKVINFLEKSIIVHDNPQEKSYCCSSSIYTIFIWCLPLMFFTVVVASLSSGVVCSYSFHLELFFQRSGKLSSSTPVTPRTA